MTKMLNFSIPKSLLLCLFCIYSIQTNGQKNEDSLKVILLCDNAWEIEQEGLQDPIPILREALLLSKKSHLPKGTADVYAQMGVHYHHQGQLRLAEQCYDSSLYLRITIGDNKGIASIYNNLGAINRDIGNYYAAQNHFNKALSRYEVLEDSLHIAKVCNQLCSLHKTLGDFPQSLEYGFRALNLRTGFLPQNSIEIGKSNLAIGGTFEYMGENERARHFYSEALRLFESQDYLRGISSSLHNLGNLEEFESNYEEALDFYGRSRALGLELRDTIGVIKTLRNIARIYRNVRKFEQAQSVLKSALKMGKNSEAKSILILIEADMAEMFLWEGRPKETINILSRISLEIDSLFQPPQKIYYRELLCIAHAALHDWDQSLQQNLDASKLRWELDLFVNAGIYQYDKHLILTRENERMKSKAEILKKDLQIRDGQSRIQKVIIFFLSVLVILIILFAYQRLRRVQEKRTAEQIKSNLDQKASEIEKLVQENELKTLEAIIETADQERHRISHDLHDGVGAKISYLGSMLAKLKNDIEHGRNELFTQIDNLAWSLGSLSEEIRSAAYDLSSPTLDKYGLVPALKGLSQVINESTEVEFELSIYGLDERLDSKIEKHLFLIIKELFNNAIRHGHANSFSTSMTKDDSVMENDLEKEPQPIIRLVIEDNGIGFPEESSAFEVSSGVGLQSVEQRINAMRGKWDIDKNKDQGTIITVEVPLNRKELK